MSHKKFGEYEQSRQKLRSRLLRYNENLELKSTSYIRPYTVKTARLEPRNPYKTLESSMKPSDAPKKPRIVSFYNA